MTGAKRKEGLFREEEGVETEEGDKIAIWMTEKATKNQVLTIYQNPIMYLILSINIICSFNDFFSSGLMVLPLRTKDFLTKAPIPE